VWDDRPGDGVCCFVWDDRLGDGVCRLVWDDRLGDGGDVDGGFVVFFLGDSLLIPLLIADLIRARMARLPEREESRAARLRDRDDMNETRFWFFARSLLVWTRQGQKVPHTHHIPHYLRWEGRPMLGTKDILGFVVNL
jgi:hypothetical protein